MGNEMICSDIEDMDIKSGGREMATVFRNENYPKQDIRTFFS